MWDKDIGVLLIHPIFQSLYINIGQMRNVFHEHAAVAEVVKQNKPHWKSVGCTCTIAFYVAICMHIPKQFLKVGKGFKHTLLF
jgi:hypothetical protein